MAWSYWICETITGERVLQVQVTKPRWSRRMNLDFGQGQVTIPVRSQEYGNFTPELFDDMLEPWSRSIVGCWDDVPVWSGGIVSPTWRPRSGEVVVPHYEVQKLLGKRLFFGAGFYSKTRFEEFASLSRQGMLIAVAKHLAGGGYGAPVAGLYPWRLPIHFPAAGAGDWSRRTYQYEFDKPWEWLRQIVEEEGGPDFVFEPGFGTGTDGVVGSQWVMHVASPRLERSVHEWDVNAPTSPLIGPELKFDAEEMYTGAFLTGEGSGKDMIVGMATPPEGGRRTPAMDVRIPGGKKVDSVQQANAIAAGYLKPRLRPVKKWKVAVKAATVLAGMHGGPNDGVRPGSRVRLRTSDDLLLGSSVSEHYVTGMSGDGSDNVTLELQPI